MTNVELQEKLAKLFSGKSWNTNAFNNVFRDLTTVYENVDWHVQFSLDERNDRTVWAWFQPDLTLEQTKGYNLSPEGSWAMADEVKKVIKNNFDNLFMRREGFHAASLRISIRQ